MVDFTRPAPHPADPGGYRYTQPLYVEPTTVPLTEAEVEQFFAVKHPIYQHLRVLAVCCISINTGLSPKTILRMTVDDINQQHLAIYFDGKVYQLRTSPCTLFTWMAERRYRPGVRHLFTGAYAKPVSLSQIHRDFFDYIHLPQAARRLRATYFQYLRGHT